MVKEGGGGGNGNDHRKLEVCVVKYLVRSSSTCTWSSYYLHSFEIVILKTEDCYLNNSTGQEAMKINISYRCFWNFVVYITTPTLFTLTIWSRHHKWGWNIWSNEYKKSLLKPLIAARNKLWFLIIIMGGSKMKQLSDVNWYIWVYMFAWYHQKKIGLMLSVFPFSNFYSTVHFTRFKIKNIFRAYHWCIRIYLKLQDIHIAKSTSSLHVLIFLIRNSFQQSFVAFTFVLVEVIETGWSW